MQNPMRMAVFDTCAKLIDQFSDFIFAQMMRFCFQILLQIVLYVFKNKVEYFSLENDLFQFNYIGVPHLL